MERYLEKIETILLEPSLDPHPHTYSSVEGLRVICAGLNGTPYVIADGSKSFRFEGEQKGGASGIRLCPMDRGNRILMNREFSWTAPAALGAGGEVVCFTEPPAEGLEELLEILREKKIRPVLVRQDPLSDEAAAERFEAAVDAASWNVYRCGFREGYGVCIDNVRSPEEVGAALEYSASMISLDPSAFEGDAPEDEQERSGRWMSLPEEDRERLESDYLNDPGLAEYGIIVDRKTLEETVLRYGEAVEFVKQAWRQMRRSMRRIDLEVSLAGFSKDTTAFAHCFIAAELERCRARMDAIELKLPEEMDTQELRLHCVIAERFGHRLSTDGRGRRPEPLKGENAYEIDHFQETGRICLRRQTKTADRQ